ncbi:MAG: cytochrome c biosis protein resB [Chloroflexi bacterium]|nr:cytochrome c biosis protein resB [Chloroflexota bacterium]
MCAVVPRISQGQDSGTEKMAVQGQRLSVSGAALLRPARIWRGLRSMTFAIIMLLVILCVVIAGSFMPQDSGIRLVYESRWFYALNFLLMASIASCAIRRSKGVYRFSFRVPVVHRPEFYRAADTSCQMTATAFPEEATRAAVKALRACHYRVELVERDGRSYILADRFRAMRLGTIVSHLSIVLMVAAIAWGAIAGWLDRSVQLEAGGQAVSLGHGTGLLLRSDSFDFGLYPNGLPRNFHNNLTIIENNGAGPTHHQLIDVNTPWYYGGIFGYDIHQADYGVAARLVVIDRSTAHPVPLSYCTIQLSTPQCGSQFPSLLMQPLGDGTYQPIGTGLSAFYLPDRDLAVTLTFRDAVPQDKLPPTAVLTVAKPPQHAGQTMRILKEQVDIPVTTRTFNGQTEAVTAQPIDVGNLRFAILIRREAFVNIGHNPAVPFIFASFGLILFGLVSVLYFPFSRLWLYVAPSDSATGSSVLLLRGSAEKSRQSFKRRFADIANRIQRELRAVSADPVTEGAHQ